MPTPKCRFNLFLGLGKCDLGGDFYQDTYEPKLFGMHIGSVLSGVEAGNVNNDHTIPK